MNYTDIEKLLPTILQCNHQDLVVLDKSQLPLALIAKKLQRDNKPVTLDNMIRVLFQLAIQDITTMVRTEQERIPEGVDLNPSKDIRFTIDGAKSQIRIEKNELHYFKLLENKNKEREEWIGFPFLERPEEENEKKPDLARIKNVAISILQEARQPMTGFKLQALCFYCQAWHFVHHKKPLFSDEFRSFHLRGGDTRLMPDLIHLEKDIDIAVCHLTKEQIECVRRTLKDYGDFSEEALFKLLAGEYVLRLHGLDDTPISNEELMEYYTHFAPKSV